MASVKISELNTLVSITSDDFIAIVDSGSGTTYRVTFNTINDWMATFGSASHADIADFAWLAHTASYTVSSSYAHTSSFSIKALTASYYDVSGFSPTNATSASYSDTSSVLHGRGASWEQEMQISRSLKLSSSAYISIGRKRDVMGESIRQNSIFFHEEYGSDAGSNDYARVYFSENILDAGRLVFEHGDNVDSLLPGGPNINYHGVNSPGFLWQTFGTGSATGSLMFLKTDGNLFVRSAEAKSFSASFSANSVGFYGTASQAITASYIIGGLPAATQMPLSVQDLWIYPYWDTFDGVSNEKKVKVAARSLVAQDTSGNTIQLTTVSQINDPTTTDVPGGLIGSSLSNGRWYDVYVIYNSGTTAHSTALYDSGVSPDTTTFSNLYSDLATAGYPDWDYGYKVGSAFLNSSGDWVQWYEYGAKVQMAYRSPHPTDIGIANGVNITHHFGATPRIIDIKLKLTTNDVYINGKGLYKGYELRAEDFIVDTDDGTVEHQPYLVISTENNVLIGWAKHDNGWETVDYNGIRMIHYPSYWNFVIYLSMT